MAGTKPHRHLPAVLQQNRVRAKWEKRLSPKLAGGNQGVALALRGTIAANLVQSTGRALKEEVTFNRSNVTRWIVPQVEIVLLNHVWVSRPATAAIANAIFDATGVGLRQAPLASAKFRAAMANA